MNPVYGDTPALSSVGAARALSVAVGLLFVVGMVAANSLPQFLAYLFVLAAAVLPSVLWTRMLSQGVPVFPAIAMAHIPYFAWPILSLSEEVLNYSTTEILTAAITSILFLISATVTWRMVADGWSARPAELEQSVDSERVVRFVVTGLSLGLAFQTAASADLLASLGALFGVVRAVMSTLIIVCCFLVGVTRAQGALTGGKWVASLVMIALLMIFAWNSLLLVVGIVFAMAVMLGYVIVAKRIPWLVVFPIVAAITVLQAGKAEMRERYWDPAYEVTGIELVIELPGRMAEWVSEGIRAMTSDSGFVTPLDRTGLLHMILLVESETPDRVEYLYGETYAMLPAILVPRFIDSDRPASQVGMDLLNIRYGLLTAEGAASTAIGWGLAAEAFANFGYPGVIGIALLLGAFCGWLQYWSHGAGVISLPVLTSIACMMVFINLELDFIQVCSILLQSFAGVLIFLGAFRWFAVR